MNSSLSAQLQHLLGDLEAALTPSTMSQRGQEQIGTYLSQLGPKLQEMDGLFSVVMLDGRLLADLLRKPPTDSSDPGVCVCVAISYSCVAEHIHLHLPPT